MADHLPPDIAIAIDCLMEASRSEGLSLVGNDGALEADAERVSAAARDKLEAAILKYRRDADGELHEDDGA